MSTFSSEHEILYKMTNRGDQVSLCRMPYLRAIQEVPGETASEKLSWISRNAHQQTGESQLPSELLPLYRVEAAVKNKNYEEITSALKSEDLTIVNRALKATWFFDGSYKKIIDDAYFVEHLFPYVSANTRKRIVNTLAYRTIGRDPEFAQRMFTTVESFYDIHTAYPLLLASGEEFAYETIVEKEHALPCRMIKKMWRAYPNLVVRYFKLLPPRSPDDADDRLLKPFGVTIHKYASFLPSLAKKRTKEFAELCEINQRSLPRIKLSNTAAKIFLKNGHLYFVKNPQLFTHMLPCKKINTKLMKIIFLSLLPEKKNDFDTDRVLEYLNYYPKDEKWELLYHSYKMAYGTELVDNRKNITFKLLQILPAEERVKLTRFLIENTTSQERTEEYYEKCLICYLSTDEAIPAIKKKINHTSDPTKRSSYISQMFYNCKVTADNDALADTLAYFLQRHKNEDYALFADTMYRIWQFFDVPHLNEKCCSLIFDIVQSCFVRHKCVDVKLAEALIHHRLINDMSIKDLIKMIISSEATMSLNFNILTKYPEYERKCLVTFLEIMKTHDYEGTYMSDCIDDQSHFDLAYMSVRLRIIEEYPINLVKAMYAFNDRCEKSKTKIERVNITDYSWLIDKIRAKIVQNKIVGYRYSYWSEKTLLKRKEPKLHDEWFSSVKIIMDVTSSEVLRLLRQNPQSIANDWQEYFELCQVHFCNKVVQRFVKATRWYNYVPIGFAERCLEILKTQTNEDLISFASIMLGLLLHGDSLTKLIDLLLSVKIKKQDLSLYTQKVDSLQCLFDAMDWQKRLDFVQCLCNGINLSNPPVSLDLVARLYRENYSSVALRATTNISRRSSVPKVKVFVQNLLSMHSNIRKYGIIVMSSVTSARQQIDFLQELWTTEKDRSMRKFVFQNIHKLFVKISTTETWNLYAGVISTLNNEDIVSGLFKPVHDIPHRYIDKYLKVWFDMLNKVADRQNTIGNYLESLKGPVCNFLPEEFVENALKRFLFYRETSFMADAMTREKARHFAIAYLSPDDKSKLVPRSKIIMDIILDATRNLSCDSHDYPVNIAVRELIFDLVCHSAIDMQAIDNMLTMFSTVLSPVEYAEPYLLLMYAKRLRRNCSPLEARDCGLKLGQEITDIIIFSPLLVPLMANVLDQFLTRSVANWIHDKGTWQLTDNEAVRESLEGQTEPAQLIDEIKLSIIEGLVEARNSYSCFIAVSILPQKYTRSKEYEERYNALIEKFRAMSDDPAIVTIFYKYLDKYVCKSQTSQSSEKSNIHVNKQSKQESQRIHKVNKTFRYWWC